uniref:Elongation factor 1-gamma-like protein n=1 Tax=Rhizophora mucronata TaxID=61149 RepID=A0A2P2MBI5_RHIMU
MALLLHSVRTYKNAYKTLIVAEYSGVEVTLVENFEMGVSNKTPEFLKMNPIGKVPVLETPDGPIFESNAIARYGKIRLSISCSIQLLCMIVLE